MTQLGPGDTYSSTRALVVFMVLLCLLASALS